MVTAGEILKTKRESLGKTISQISQETKIQERFLEYIENNEYEKFDSDVFVNGFIKIYSENLGLDTERVLALYRRGNGNIQNTTGKKNTSTKKKTEKKIFSPKTISIGIICIFAVLILGYIGYEIYLFQNPPILEITSPKDGAVTSAEIITIEGTTKNSTSLDISGTNEDINSDGSFSFKYKLEKGENSLTITASKDKTNQEVSKILTVTYEPEESAEENTDTEEQETYILKLVIVDLATWIKLDIDGVNKVSKTLEPSETEYSVTERFEIISGKPSNTQIYLNDELYSLKLDPSSGTYSLSCEIVQSGIVCE